MSIINVNEIGPVSFGSTVTITAGSTLRLPTNSRISGDTGSIIVPGMIVQVQFKRYDPNTDQYTEVAQNTKAYSDFGEMSFTPKFSNSKLYLSSSLHVRLNPNFGCTFGIDEVLNGVTTGLDGMAYRSGTSLDFFYKGESANHHYTGRCVAYINAGSTATRSYKLWAWGVNEGGVWELSYGHGEHSLMIMEVAQ